MEQRYFIELAFKGTAYNGWQIQPNAQGIQQVIEEAIAILIKEKVRVTGAGRTDTGVHASFYVAHFATATGLTGQLPESVRKLNHILPPDIAIKSIYPVGPDDHSRFSALSRTYKYYISLRKNPFRQETSYHINYRLDIAAMNNVAAELFKHSDFKSFCRSNSGVKNFNCHIMEAKWEVYDDMLIFTIKADRFLRNMVRAIVGTILDAGTGKISAEEFMNIILARDRRKAGTSAPANGLFITDIEYPAEILSQKKNFDESGFFVSGT